MSKWRVDFFGSVCVVAAILVVAGLWVVTDVMRNQRQAISTLEDKLSAAEALLDTLHIQETPGKDGDTVVVTLPSFTAPDGKSALHYYLQCGPGFSLSCVPVAAPAPKPQRKKHKDATQYRDPCVTDSFCAPACQQGCLSPKNWNPLIVCDHAPPNATCQQIPATPNDDNGIQYNRGGSLSFCTSDTDKDCVVVPLAAPDCPTMQPGVK